MPVTRSPMMDKLYGVELSKQVYENLGKLDSALNDEIQEIAYNRYWSLPGLSIRDKALVTVISLICMRKEVQTRPHMIGFLNTGGTTQDLVNALLNLSAIVGETSTQKGFEALCDVLRERKEVVSIIKTMQDNFNKHIRDSIPKNNCIKLSKRDEHIINVAACVAIGEQEKTTESIKNFLCEPSCDKNDLRFILIHQIVYCGFPSAVNGFGALKAALEEKPSPSLPRARL